MNKTEFQISPRGARPGITGQILYVKTDKYPTGKMKTGHTHLATIKHLPQEREKIMSKPYRTNNSGVINAWTRGESARNSKNTLWTNGSNLYSYALCIGVRGDRGATIVGDYTAGGGGYHSQTTSCHVGRARRIAADVQPPRVFEATKLADKYVIR